ncbi:MAG: hypothetical protein CPSOU_2538 [uncultured Paraburkholderia sp.]|nr:MAG: hypothetical protein CPSOU_2538 [uncultured Paraburkholderia sp.]
MPCAHFENLKQRIAGLRAKFLDDQISNEANDPAGFQADLDRLAAFRLLAHAEIEEFLETKASEGINRIEAAYRSGAQSIQANASIFVMGRVLELGSDERAMRFEVLGWEGYFIGVVRAAKKFISENNGIKEGSFKHLALFSGKMPDEIDAALAFALNSYGKSRGDVAHKSAAGVRTLRAPSAEAKDVEDILKGLQSFFVPAPAN